MGKAILVEVGEDGKIQYKMVGFRGKVCLGEADKLKKALTTLGLEGEIKDIVPTEEMAQQEESTYVKQKAKEGSD